MSSINRILIIEDDVHGGNLLEELLTRKGCEVSRAYSGTEALMVSDTVQPDLILMYLMLPGLFGKQVLPQIQKIPVIVLSAKANVDSKVSLLLRGAVGYVAKFFDIRELLACIPVALRSKVLAGDGLLAHGDLCPNTVIPSSSLLRTIFTMNLLRGKPSWKKV